MLGNFLVKIFYKISLIKQLNEVTKKCIDLQQENITLVNYLTQFKDLRERSHELVKRVEELESLRELVKERKNKASTPALDKSGSNKKL